MAGLVLGLATTGALLAAGLAGCGGGGAKANAAATPSGTAGGQQELQAYVSCLQQHGVQITLPSGRPTAFPSGGLRGSNRPTARPSGSRGPGAGGGFGGGGFGDLFGNNGQPPAGVDQATWDAAQQACASTRPSFGPGVGGQRDNGAAAAYLNCLRDHGVTASGGPNRLNTADPSVAGAVQACAALRPTARPSTSPTA
jgi:hypothetical protein